MIEGDFTVNTAGEYQLQAVANKETVTSEAVTVEKLDQTAVFETQQDAFHFNEAVRYELMVFVLVMPSTLYLMNRVRLSRTVMQRSHMIKTTNHTVLS